MKIEKNAQKSILNKPEKNPVQRKENVQAKAINYFSNIFPKTVAVFKKLDTFATLLREAKSLIKTTKIIGV